MTSSVASGTILSTVTSIAYLFHPAANTNRIEIVRVVVTAIGGTGTGGRFRLANNFITAENAVPGGTVETINPHDRADVASTLTFRTGATGAPTRVAGDLFSHDVIVGDMGIQKRVDLLPYGKPIVLRASVAEGFEVRTVIENALGSSLFLLVFMTWQEFVG